MRLWPRSEQLILEVAALIQIKSFSSRNWLKHYAASVQDTCTHILLPHWLYSLIQALAASMKLSVSLQLQDLGQSAGLLGRLISSSQGHSTCTQTQKNAHTNTKHPCPEWVGTHGHGVRVGEDSSCLWPLCYRDWHLHITGSKTLCLVPLFEMRTRSPPQIFN
jgi:hypothetical protein